MSPTITVISVLEALQDLLIADEEMVMRLNQGIKEFRLVKTAVELRCVKIEEYAGALKIESKSQLERLTSMVIEEQALITAKWVVSRFEASGKSFVPRWNFSEHDWKGLENAQHCSIEEAGRIGRFAFEGRSFEMLRGILGLGFSRRGLIQQLLRYKLILPFLRLGPVQRLLRRGRIRWLLSHALVFASLAGNGDTSEVTSRSRASRCIQLFTTNLRCPRIWQRVQRLCRARVAPGFRRVEWTCVSYPMISCC